MSRSRTGLPLEDNPISRAARVHSADAADVGDAPPLVLPPPWGARLMADIQQGIQQPAEQSHRWVIEGASQSK